MSKNAKGLTIQLLIEDYYGMSKLGCLIVNITDQAQATELGEVKTLVGPSGAAVARIRIVS
jgi:hypothetical protein